MFDCCLLFPQLAELRELTGEHVALPNPQYLFELKYDEQREAAFADKSADRSIIYAYHGSKPENFYSILHHGLHAHMNKVRWELSLRYLCFTDSLLYFYFQF